MLPITRREFLRRSGTVTLAVVATATTASTTFFDRLGVKQRWPCTPDEREAIMASALDTAEGRKALAEAMREPHVCSLRYSDYYIKLESSGELPEELRRLPARSNT